MGFYAPAQIIHNAREHGVAIRSTDVNASIGDNIRSGGLLAAGLRRSRLLRAGLGRPELSVVYLFGAGLGLMAVRNLRARMA